MTLALWLAAGSAVAQLQLGPSELARARAVLDLYKAELSAEQYTLLSTQLAQTRQAYAELTTLTEVGTGAAAVATEGAAVAEMAATVLEALPVLLFVYPLTAHAPGMKEEKPPVRAARAKLEASVKDLTEAVRRVEKERQAATVQKKPGDPAPDFVPNNWVYPTGKRPCDVIGSGGDGLSKPGPIRAKVTCRYLCGAKQVEREFLGNSFQVCLDPKNRLTY